MSIIFCEKHDRKWDSDYLEECPLCENEESTREEDVDDPRHGQADHINRENRVGRWKQ